MSQLSEQKMRDLELKIPQLAKEATRLAYDKAITSKFSVVKVEGNSIVEISPDGSCKVLKKLKEPEKVRLNKKVSLQFR